MLGFFFICFFFFYKKKRWILLKAWLKKWCFCFGIFCDWSTDLYVTIGYALTRDGKFFVISAATVFIIGYGVQFWYGLRAIPDKATAKQKFTAYVMLVLGLGGLVITFYEGKSINMWWYMRMESLESGIQVTCTHETFYLDLNFFFFASLYDPPISPP